MILLLIFILILLTKLLLANESDWKLWLGIYAFYMLYMTITNLYVKNPASDFFISIDQVHFYLESSSLAGSSFHNIVDSTFGYSFNQAPLAYFIFAYIIKFARLLGIVNEYYFLKMSVVYAGSLIFPIMAKIVRNYGYEGRDINKAIVLFAMLTPVLSFSCQILRDAHVCLLFTLMFYVAVKENCKLRYLWILLMAVITYYLRPENGLFAAMFLILALLNAGYKKNSTFLKIVLLAGIVVGVAASFGYVYSVMMETLTGYTERSLDTADAGSLGVRLNSLPFPLNILSKTAFGQILPFPCWAPLIHGEAYSYLRILECFIPFFWVPVLLSVCYALLRKRDVMPKIFTLSFIVFLTYIILSSASTFDPRRVMAVYPALYSLFIVVNRENDLKKSIINRIVIVGLFALYIIYLFIK